MSCIAVMSLNLRKSQTDLGSIIMSGAVNCHRWLIEQVAPFIGHRIFDIGAGIGN